MQCFAVAVAGGSGTAGAPRSATRKPRSTAPVAPRKKAARITPQPPSSPPQRTPRGRSPTPRPAAVPRSAPSAPTPAVAPAAANQSAPVPAGGGPVAGSSRKGGTRVTRKPRRRRARGLSQNPNRSFAAYMDEVTSTGLLEQREVVALAGAIRDGVRVEDTQRELSARLKRRPSLPELAVELGLPPDAVSVALLRGTAAKNRLVAANLRLVTNIARKIHGSKSGGAGSPDGALALEDMIQEGSVGLIRAAEKFDASRGYKFSTYATWWIRASVFRAITSQSRSIRVPSTIVDEYARIRKEYVRQTTAGAFEPPEASIAAALGITVAKMRFVIQVVTRKPASLDLSVGDGDGVRNTLVELVEGDDKVEERLVERMQRIELDKALVKVLKPMERASIRLRFGLDDGIPRTLREIGGMLGLSKERVRQLTFGALAKLNTPEMRQTLADYLD